VYQSLERCTAVLAATCQGTAGGQMYILKGVTGGKTPSSESVVIDEAARANPLDLLIPMAQARRRIILVGDHRQLPHILDYKLYEQLQSASTEETKKAIEESLFERLFRLLKSREATDGVERTVTLDVQYRMHKVLGDFVSDQFYAEFKEGFSSGGKEADLAQDLPRYEGRVAAWLDVPASAGMESRGQSKSRRVEARALAAELKRLMDHDRDHRMSFGVIGFYSAQVPLLYSELADQGLLIGSEKGRYRVAPEYDDLRDHVGKVIAGEERLRVGTVDAFQGKEFDVVLLSLTRSNTIRPRDAEGRRSKYGFLMLPNRLCVAMSRQKRLLIVVGDAAMAQGPDAVEAVKALAAFHVLCGGEHGARY
jgi:superfamily I DNA and/or RNA helicase